jgi:RimJ/RimL family protein N-acetyltransferase
MESIKGNGFILRSFRMSDKEALVKYGNNKNISDNLRDRFPYPYTIEGAELFINSVLSDNEPVKNFIIEINEEAVGAISFWPGEDVYRLTAEIGYWLGEPFWGRGIMTEAISKVVDHIFTNFNIKKLFAMPFATSIGSMKALEKAGFQKEATISKGVIKNGRILDYHIYSIENFGK